jgi:L,D-transpeptidase YcbB
MNKKGFSYPFIALLLFSLYLASCKEASKPPDSVIVNTPEEANEKATDLIRRSLDFAASNNGDIGDSVILTEARLLQLIYGKNEYTPLWSSAEQWKPMGDSLFDFISHSRLYGLFPSDYHYLLLDTIRTRIMMDSTGRGDRRDVALWSKADLLLTDAILHIFRDVKLGRLPQDSVTLRKDSVLTDDFYEQQLNILQRSGSIVRMIRHLEPKHQGYHELKAAIPAFIDSADYSAYTIVPIPGKDVPDFKKLLQTRLYEGGYLLQDSIPADSLTLVQAIKQFQKDAMITVDGRAGEGTVRMLNMTTEEKFVRIALSLDKYKLLPEEMPERYVWVNLPSYYMKLQVGDSVKLVSKIVCGKPKNRTPLLNSAISELVTYPQWTVPASIIQKEILPAIKRDSNYLAKKGFSLLDKEGNEVDPHTVEWSKYKKGIPYRVVQGSGDANALGVLKFNFPNKYAVYLHDTNQRSLFGLTYRSLSHGCVRVQEWDKLAYYIVRNDRVETASGRPSAVADSMTAWLERKEKHSIPLKNKLPVFIRYITAEAKDGGILFYDDMYGEDKRLQEKHFAGKS